MLARKAPELAVQAFAELRKTTQARLVMAGDGPLLPQVRAEVAELGLTEDVELLGRVPWPKLAELYDSASVFLFCSLRDSSSAQFLEAMGKGLPAVILDLHGMADVKVGIAAEKVPLTLKPEELPGQSGGRHANRGGRRRLGGAQRRGHRVGVRKHVPRQGRGSVAHLPGDRPTMRLSRIPAGKAAW